MISQFFLSGICNLCGGRCKEKPVSQFASKWRKDVRWKNVNLGHILDKPLSHEGGFLKVDYPF